MSAQISIFKFKILVVDDDSTSLNVISSMLKSWKYEVYTAKCPLDALATVRVQQIDLIVSDLHMPKMNGLQLQKRIDAESKLPVIIMSSDDNKKIILNSLSRGAVFFISKPATSMDFKNVWQYAVASKRDKSMKYIERIGSIQAAGSLPEINEKPSYKGENNASSGNEGKPTRNKKYGRRKSDHKKNKEAVEGRNPTALKKAKVVWNNTLHNRFLEAIRYISLEKAVPKKILEFMNVPGLTRENIASHLQKYRIFLKKVAEKGYGVTSKNSLSIDRTLRSSFAAGHPSLLFHNSQEAYSPFKGLEKHTSPFQSINFGSISGLSSSNSGLQSLSRPSPLGFGQSRLLGGSTQANVRTPLLGNTTNHLYQPNRTGGFGLGSTDIGTNMLSCGGAMSGTNSMQIPDLHNNMSTPLLGTSGICNNNIDRTGTTVNVPFSCLNPNMNHAGIQINNEGDLIATGGQMRLIGNHDGLNGAGSVGLMNNGAQTPGLSVGAIGNSTFGACLAPGESSSAGFNHGNYQVPTSFSGVNFVQGTTSALPSMTQQQLGLGNNEHNDFISDLLNDNNNVASGFNNIADPLQFGEFHNMLTESTNFHQQQGGELGVQNPNFTSNSSIPVETKPRASQPLDDFDFPSPCNVDENRPWNEPSLEQLQEIQELLNPDLEENIANSSDGYHPILDENPNQQQGEDDFKKYELGGLLSSENAGSKNKFSLQGWADDFVDSFLGDRLF